LVRGTQIGVIRPFLSARTVAEEAFAPDTVTRWWGLNSAAVVTVSVPDPVIVRPERDA
jgi:hypothetical protein